MSIGCTRCEQTGFLNIEHVPQDIANLDVLAILEWIKANSGHDAQVCDCCGDGEEWYGEPGKHYTDEDPTGKRGPYAYNGGLCECH
ncbi:MAG: hypothetical protein ACR2QF_13940 [Geminicoccaceae bacterium]